MSIYQMEEENPSKTIMGLLCTFKVRRFLRREKICCVYVYVCVSQKKIAHLCALVYMSVYRITVEDFSFEKAISAKLIFFTFI